MLSLTAASLWVMRSLPLISSSTFFLCNSSVAVTGHTRHRLSHKSALPGTILICFGPVMHSAHINTGITINNPYLGVNFNWRGSFGSQKLITACCLKCLDECLMSTSISLTIATHPLNTTACWQLKWKNRSYRTCPNLWHFSAAICWQVILGGITFHSLLIVWKEVLPPASLLSWEWKLHQLFYYCIM